MNNYEQEANKFEQEVDAILDKSPRSVGKIIQSISTLHDTEMIAFAEWCGKSPYEFNECAGLWVEPYLKDTHTTAQLLTIFRNEQNK